MLFQDGDLVFVTPDAVLGIIEVKTSLDNSSLKTAVQNLSANIELVQSKSTGRRVFGLFSYEDGTTDIEQTLKIIKDGVPARGSRAIHCICLGKSTFIRFWHFDPVSGRSIINTWHGYNLKEKAPGYFIHNIIEEICPQSVEENKALWYPKEGKKSYKVGEIAMGTIDE